MKTSPRGIEDLVLSEGLRTKAYRDSRECMGRVAASLMGQPA